MIYIYKCEYCDKNFNSEQECLQHETNKHKRRYYKKEIYSILDGLNKKYNQDKEINESTLCIEEFDEECGGFSYTMINIKFYIESYCIDECCSENDIINKIKKQMEKCFLKNSYELEGKLEYEFNYYNSDYIINGIYLRDFLQGKQGKKIQIKIEK